MTEEKTPVIDKEVFDTFFRESYCELEYAQVKTDFEEIADHGLDELFAQDTDYSKLTEKNFVIYMRSDVYCEFEAIVEESFDTLNTEIVDAVMDVSTTMDDEDEITGAYWDTCEELLKKFLQQLFREKIGPMLKNR